MAMFIMLARLSAEGVRSLKNNPHRIQEVNQEVEQFGARVVQQYALLGPYDFITVLEAPDPETVSRVSVELASRGAASYETLTAISVDEFVSRLGGEDVPRRESVPRRGMGLPLSVWEAPPGLQEEQKEMLPCRRGSRQGKTSKT